MAASRLPCNNLLALLEVAEIDACEGAILFRFATTQNSRATFDL